MGISFNQVPASLRVPFIAAEFDNSRAAQGPALLPYRAILLGQKLPSASAAANSLRLVTSADQVLTLCGRGSMLHRMALAYFAKNKGTETWIGVLADAPAGVIAQGTATVSGTATEDGSIALYVGGERVLVPVASGDSASVIAANMATAIGKHASGTFTFATAIATNTFTVGGVTFTGAAGSATPGAATFSIDTGDTAAAASAAAQVSAHAVASTLVRASSSGAVMTVRAVAGGTSGNSIATTATGGTITPSAATLTGATADTDLAAHASVASTVATLRAMNAGAVGNEIDLRLNYAGEELPAGVTVALAAMSGGSTNPVLTSLIAAMGDSWYQIWASPYTDATSLTAIETELSSRFGPMRMIDGMAFCAKHDTYSNVATLGESRNSPHVSIARMNESPTWSAEAAAHIAGAVAIEASIDPARPLQTVALEWIKAPAEADRDTLQERNLLLFDGVSTLSVAPGDVVQIERLITTYQKNGAGTPDTSYLDVTTMLTLLYLRYSFRVRISTRYPRAKLASDDAVLTAGQAIITPSVGKAEAVSWFHDMEDLGLVEGFDQFKTDLIVVRSDTDPNRLDFKLSPNLINQLIVGAAQIQFLL